VADMKRWLLLLLLLPGCKGMTNDEIIAEVQKCEKAGLKAEVIKYGINFRTERVQCVPRN
jgi:hypothetical protein